MSDDLVTRLRSELRESQEIVQYLSLFEGADARLAVKAERDALRARVSELESGKRTWEQDASRFKAAHDASFMQVVTERDALRRDAERYRWIRDADKSDAHGSEWTLYAMESLDEFIDAALREGGK